MTNYLEPWYANETYLLLAGDGTRRLLQTERGRISVCESRDDTDYAAKLREFLVAYLRSAERAALAKKGLPDSPKLDFDTFSTEDLFGLAIRFA